MVSGTVKWFNPRKGFGFIEQEDGKDVFVHMSDVEKAGLTDLNEGESLTFDVEEGDKGQRAVNLKKA